MERLQLDESIAFIPRKQAYTLLGIEESTLRSYQWALNRIKPKNWDYIPNSKGFTRQSLEVLWIYRQLILILGQEQAIKKLKEVLNHETIN